MAMRSCKMLIVDIEHDDRAKRAMNKIIAGKYFTFHISIASDKIGNTSFAETQASTSYID